MIQIQNAVIGMCATNTYFVWNDAGKGIIVDPAGDPMRIFDTVEKCNFMPEAILLTHGHFDHILAVNEVRNQYKIKAYIGINEKEVLHSPELNLTKSFLGENMTVDADVYLFDNEEINIAGWRIKCIKVPGHTPGGMCYYFRGENVIFSGDTLFCESVGRSDFPGGSGRALYLGIKERLLTLPDDTKVYPGHMEPTTIAHEKEYNPFCS